MSKAEDTYIAATKDFVKAKTAKEKNPKAYNAAKEKLHVARIAWRAERDKEQTGGVAVSPATLSVKAAINNGG